ncbi:chromosomal replication initiator protein DnaA [Patescibacteria group bacterium]|nr:chromosomal replication initiator protein DnaA [Patescibacteria group bacterium]
MSLKDFWKEVLVKIEPTVKRANFVTWFQDTGVLSMEEGKMMIGVPTPFAHDWLKKYHEKQILDMAREIDPQINSVDFEVHSSLKGKDDIRKIDVKKLKTSSTKSVRKISRANEVMLVEGISSKCLNPKYTLDNFIVGSENRLAHASCLAVASNPGGYYNPLFVYGGVGLGKTHLLQATGNSILQTVEDSLVVYTTSENFVNEIVEAIRNSGTKRFREKYRKVSCLIIDDIQFLANKEQTQTEFFHTFNELYDYNKQIIISSDRPPSSLAGIEDRLVSRFDMGMIVDIQFPGYETRLAILQAKCQQNGVIIPREVLEFISENVHNSVRELEGVLKQAIAQSQLENSVPTINSVSKILQKLNKDIPLVTPGIAGVDEGQKIAARVAEDVVTEVSAYYKLSQRDLIGLDRRKEVMMPRQIAMYLIRNELRYSLESVGEIFMGRNHTTVMHACLKVKKLLKVDSKTVRDVNAVKRALGL